MGPVRIFFSQPLSICSKVHNLTIQTKKNGQKCREMPYHPPLKIESAAPFLAENRPLGENAIHVKNDIYSTFCN